MTIKDKFKKYIYIFLFYFYFFKMQTNYTLLVGFRDEGSNLHFVCYF